MPDDGSGKNTRPAKFFEYNTETRKGPQRRKTVERKDCPDYAAWIGIAQ